MSDDDTVTEDTDFELLDIQDQAEEVGFLTPREFAKLEGISPQLVYYYIRTKKITDERCKCGRRVLNVEASRKAIQAQARKRRGDLAGVLDARDRAVEEGQRLEVQGVSEDSGVEEATVEVRDPEW